MTYVQQKNDSPAHWTTAIEERRAIAPTAALHGANPLNEISAELGFSNPSHYSAVFGRLTGTSPSA